MRLLALGHAGELPLRRIKLLKGFLHGGGGAAGGELVYAGPRAGIEQEPRSLTGEALHRWAARG